MVWSYTSTLATLTSSSLSQIWSACGRGNTVGQRRGRERGAGKADQWGCFSRRGLECSAAHAAVEWWAARSEDLLPQHVTAHCNHKTGRPRPPRPPAQRAPPTSSTIFLSSMTLGPRFTAEQVMTALGLESTMRPARLSAEKPANTTEKTAPMRAQASCGRGAAERAAQSGRRAAVSGLRLREAARAWAASGAGCAGSAGRGRGWAEALRPCKRQLMMSSPWRRAARGSWACRW